MDDLLLAIGGFIGAVIAAVVAIVSAGKEDQKLRRSLIILAMAGLVVAGVCAALQYRSTKDSDAKRKAAENETRKSQQELHDTKEELDKATKLLGAASVNVNDLAQLNSLSPGGQFYVRLSVDPDPCKPCDRERKIDDQFPGAIASQGIRVINVGHGGQPYQLIFGKQLSLAAAGVYQRLAIDHGLANERPLIESEKGAEVVVDCSKECPARGHAGQ